MHFYKKTNDAGEVVLLMTYDHEPTITDPNVVEITAEEYVELLDEMTAEPEPTDEDEATEADLYGALAELGVTE